MRPEEKKTLAFQNGTWIPRSVGPWAPRCGGEALLDALHVLQSVPAAVLQTEFDRSRSSDRNPKFHKLTSSTNK
jgi:hypothetical protein